LESPNTKSLVVDAVESMEYLPLSALNQMQGNLKNLEKAEYDKLRSSILTLGFSAPFFCWKDDKGKAWLIDGTQRSKVLGVLAGEGVQLPDTYPVVFVRAKDKQEAAKKLLVITSSYAKTTESGLADFALDFNVDMEFIEQFTRIPDVSFDLPDESPSPVEGEDDVPDVPKESVIERGEVWLLGNHRLMCGDSTSIDAVEKLMSGEKADMVYTDPPYGMKIVKKDGNNNGLGQSVDGVVGVAARGKYRPVIGDDSTLTAKDAYNLCAGLQIDKLIFWGANFYAESLPPSSGWIVWDKENGEGFFADGELAWTNDDKQLRIFKHQWKGMIRDSERGEKRVHPTQKPIALAEWCFENYGDPKSVLDLFGGSGSTLIACEKTNRKCYMMELDRHYCSVIIERWQKFAGKVAVRESDGVEYNSLIS